LLVLPVKDEDARVSRAVVPPKAISHAVHMANMYEKAAVARFSGDDCPTIRTDIVCKLFCNVYARMTGVLPLSSKANSARTRRLLEYFASSPSSFPLSRSGGLGMSSVDSFGMDSVVTTLFAMMPRMVCLSWIFRDVIFKKHGNLEEVRLREYIGTEPEYIGANLYLCQDNACMRAGPCGSPR
jgi:predicted PP-loop superfamily ATPase